MPGGQVSLVTRSGSNAFHGSVSEYFRHTTTDANDWFANSRGQANAKEIQNFHGGVFGRHLRPNRVFFFASYEGMRLDLPTTKVVSVPTLALRTQVIKHARE
jgi:hypothetical protein